MKSLTEKVKEVRENLKKALPNCKFSVRKNDYLSMSVSLMSSPIDFGAEYKSVNEYFIERTYEGDQRDLLMQIKSIAFDGVRYYETGDYGTQPDTYIKISIGQWDKPYQVK